MKTNSYFILWILLLMFSLNGNSQFKEDLECGTEVDPDSYLHDFSYANNKKLIEIILQENIPIPEGYFEYLGMKKPEGLNRFDVAEKIYIPIKLWVYREDNGAGNMGVAQAYTLIEELNQIYANNTNFAFYLLCDISFINNSTYANNSQYFETYTLQNKMPNVLNVHVVLDFIRKIG